MTRGRAGPAQAAVAAIREKDERISELQAGVAGSALQPPHSPEAQAEAEALRRRVATLEAERERSREALQGQNNIIRELREQLRSALGSVDENTVEARAAQVPPRPARSATCGARCVKPRHHEA